MLVTSLRGMETDRADFRAAIADTHAVADALRDDFRGHREHYVRTSESLAVERRILREDFAQWSDASA